MGSLLRHGRDASGQYYRRNRYYDAGTGRFTQEDPIGLAGGLNLYGYANGDPIMYHDPYGLSADTLPSVEPSAEPRAGRGEGERGKLNPVKLAVGAVNVVRGVTGMAQGAGELLVASAGGTFASVAAVPGTWHLASGLSNLNRGSMQLGESLNDRSGPSAKNVLGLLPFGQQFDDPAEPGPVEWARGVAQNAARDPIRMLKQAVSEFFALKR